jgi:hypothetical protein
VDKKEEGCVAGPDRPMGARRPGHTTYEHARRFSQDWAGTEGSISKKVEGLFHKNGRDGELTAESIRALLIGEIFLGCGTLASPAHAA